MSVLVSLVVMVGMLVIVPLGLRLVEPPGAPGGDRPSGLTSLRRLWPVPAALGAVALWLPRGPAAGLLACCYGLATVALALQAPVRLARTRSLAPAEIAVLTALVAPAVAGTALVAACWGQPLFGFGPQVLALTVAHFHFAGFAAALVASLVCRVTAGRAGRFAALSVPSGTLLVLVGFFTGDRTELAGAVVLTAGMWTVALLTWRELRSRAPDRITGTLLAVSACVLAATMLLALSWALGEATGTAHPDLGWMAATHGVGNALGFALCSILALRRLKESTV